jgi:death-on-curing protein
VRYLSLAEALVVAEAVTGLDLTTLSRSPRIDLLDSALHAPQASFGGQELYPGFIDKAAVLAVRIAKNHPLLDGNKRLAWGCLVMFLMLNGHQLEVPADDAVSTMLAVASGECDEAGMALWLADRIEHAQ